MHINVETGLQSRVPELDQALAALLNDLDERGMLDTTLVAVGTEFGRTPNINMNSGRDHFPAAYSSMLAGGGIQGGQVYGSTDKQGKKVTRDHMRPEDFLATIGYDEWTGEEEKYLGIPGGRMCWSHADEATNVRWLQEAGLHVHWTEFVPEEDSGHTLVLAQKPPITKAPASPSSTGT